MITINDEHTNPNLARKKRYSIYVPGRKTYTGTDVVWISDFRVKFTTDDGESVEISSPNGIEVTSLKNRPDFPERATGI